MARFDGKAKLVVTDIKLDAAKATADAIVSAGGQAIGRCEPPELDEHD